MNQEKTARLDSLEQKTKLTPSESEECSSLYKDRGHLSKQYEGRPFLNVKLIDLQDYIAIDTLLSNLFENIKIKTVSDLLDIKRVEISGLRGAGDGKWKKIYDLRKNVIANIVAIEYHICGVTPEFTNSGMNNYRPNGTSKKTPTKPSSQYVNYPIYNVHICSSHKENLGSKIYAYCEKAGITRLIEILDITNSQITQVPKYGKKTICDLKKAQEWIMNNMGEIVAVYDRNEVVHEFPVLKEDEMDLGLEDRVRIAMSQIYDVARKINDKELVANMDSFYLHPITEEDIDNETDLQQQQGRNLGRAEIRGVLLNIRRKQYGLEPLTYQRIDGKLLEYNKAIFERKSISSNTNVVLRQDIINDLKNYEADCLYMAGADAAAGLDKDKDFDLQQSIVFKLLGLNTTMTKPEDSIRYDQKYVIPRQIQNSKDKSLVASYLEAIHRTLSKNFNLKERASMVYEVRPMGYDEMVEYMYEHELISDGKGLISQLDRDILKKLLESYSHVECINENGVDKYQIKYECLNVAGKFARIIYENGENGVKKKDALSVNIKKLPFENHVSFARYLRDKSHTITNNFDWISNSNGTYYYSPRNLRASIKEGVAKFVSATNGELFTLNDLMVYLKQNECPERTNHLVKGYVSDLCEENASIRDQFCDKRFIDKHPEIKWYNKIDNVSFEDTLKIQKAIVDKLASCEGNKMSLSEVMHFCMNNFSDVCNDYAFFYKIINSMADNVTKIISENTTYLMLTKGKSDVKTESDNVDDKRGFSWETLSDVMYKQMNKYYTVFYDYKNATDKFLNFLQNSVQHPDLKKYFPRLLLRFWQGENEEYDLYDIITNISTNFEGFLREIYRVNNGEEMPEADGLRSVVFYLKDFEKWQRNNWNNAFVQPAIKYYRNLYNIRNKRAHTQALNFTTEQYKKNIEEIIVLYVFTVDKFVQAC